MKKRQFRGTSKPKQFYDRKVRKVGYTRVISLGKAIPPDWKYVRIHILNKTPNTVELLLEKLLGTNNHAQTTKTHKTNKQNTP